MTQALDRVDQLTPFPDHTQLPESDGTFVKNFQEHPQSIILTDSLGPILQQIHPDGQYAIGQDSGIYWRETEPPEKGAEAPDWFYVPNVPPLLDGKIRRSYVLWRELMPPFIVLEFASGDGSEERDKTPLAGTKPGKFWVYEQIIRPAYYGIFVIATASLEFYHLMNGVYHPLEPNERGHYPIEQLGIELGVWQGSYQNQTQHWLRWWDKTGNLLLTGWEQAELERGSVEREQQRAEFERQRAEFERQRAEQEQQRAEFEHQQAEFERQRAEQEQQRAEFERQRVQELETNQREAIKRLHNMGLTLEQIAQALNLSIEEITRIVVD